MTCRCAEVVVKLQLCTEQLSQLSDILPHLEVDRHTHTHTHTEGGGGVGEREEGEKRDGWRLS